MIKKIKLKNFKCFIEQDIPVDRFTILAGANASGKSSIVQSILLAKETSESLKYHDGVAKETFVDVAKLFSKGIGTPKALIANDGDDNEEYDFSITIIGNEEQEYQYVVEPENPLNLKLYYSKEIKEVEEMPNIAYLNAERIGPRLVYHAGGEEKILPDGSNSAYLIARAEIVQKKVPDALILENGTGSFQKQVEAWLSAILGEVRLVVTVDQIRAQAEVRVENEVSKDLVVPTMTGFGISYILPIVVAGLWCACEKNTMLIIENPETHLHPEAQSQIGKFLAILSKAGVQVLVETHSEHIIDGARVQMAYMESTEQMKVIFTKVEDGKIKLIEIGVDEAGNLSDWPAGFFDQKSMDLRKLFELKRSKRVH